MKRKIYVTCNWGDSNKVITDWYKNFTPFNNGTWNSLELTNNQDEADFVLVLDGTRENILDNNKVIFFGREPAHIALNVWNKPAYGIYHHEFGNSWLASTWWLKSNYTELSNLSNTIQKLNNLSIIDSGKTSINGHVQRLHLISNIVNNHSNDVDVYGYITRNQVKPCFKTVLPHKQKDNGLLPYRYNLAIENGSTDYYFSEKFIDPLLCWTMPIYWGCKKIDQFFPKGSYINIDINDPKAPEKIIEISKSDYREQNIEAMAEARDLILNKYNVFPTLEKAIIERNIL